MFSDLGLRVVAVDLDPQADLTASFFGEEFLEKLWSDSRVPSAISIVYNQLYLIPWTPKRLEIYDSVGPVSFRSELSENGDIILVDLGTDFGRINRNILADADYFVIPVAPDIFGVQRMRSVGVDLRRSSLEHNGGARPLGYVVQQHSVRLDRPLSSYDKWLAKIPGEFRRSILGESAGQEGASVKDDPWCLALLKHYHSLMPMAQEAQKPMFHLTAADGAIGAHFQAAQSAGKDFEKLAKRIAERAGLRLPQLSGA